MLPRYYLVNKDRQNRACFMEYSVEIVDGKSVPIDAGFISQQVRSSLGNTIIVKATNDIIRVIRAEINTPNLQLIPYGMVLRAFLIERGVELTHTIVFVDYQEQYAWITIIDNDYFGAPRFIPNSQQDLIKHEIERTVRHFEMTNEQKTGSVRVISNRELGIDQPINEGLFIGNYSINFDLPEVIIKRKKREYYTQFIATTAGLILTLLIVAALVVNFKQQREQLNQHADEIGDAMTELRVEIASLKSKRIPALIKEFPKIPFDQLYQYATKFHGFGMIFNSLTCELVNERDWLITIRYLISREFISKDYPQIHPKQNVAFKNTSQGLMMEVQFKYE